MFDFLVWDWALSPWFYFEQLFVYKVGFFILIFSLNSKEVQAENFFSPKYKLLAQGKSVGIFYFLEEDSQKKRNV